MIKNGLAEGMVTRKLCVEVLDLVLTSFQTSFFSAPTVSKVQIADMLLLSTSFFSYPLPRSHRQGGFEKKNVSIHKLFLSFPNKGGCSYVKSGFKLRAKDEPQVFSGSNSFGWSLGCAYANLVTLFTAWTSSSGGFRPQATVHLSI